MNIRNDGIFSFTSKVGLKRGESFPSMVSPFSMEPGGMKVGFWVRWPPGTTAIPVAYVRRG